MLLKSLVYKLYFVDWVSFFVFTTTGPGTALTVKSLALRKTRLRFAMPMMCGVCRAMAARRAG